jgi:hypothetical protein
MNLKVLNKKDISSLLKEGHILQYITIAGKVYIIDKDNYDRLGSVRFDTYLKLLPQLEKLPYEGTAIYDEYKLKGDK